MDKHFCEVCFEDSAFHPEVSRDCGERHWPPLCCEGCPCESFERAHRESFFVTDPLRDAPDGAILDLADCGHPGLWIRAGDTWEPI